MRGASTNCFYKRLFRLAGNERLKTQADQTQAHAHATGAMALDGLGLAGGLIATGTRPGCGLGDLRLGLRCRCRLGLNDGRLDLLDLGRGRLRIRSWGGLCLGGGLRSRGSGLGRFLHGGLCGSLGLIHRGSGNRFRFGGCPMFNLGLNSFFGHTFLLLCALLRGGLGVAIGTLQ